MAYSRLFSRLRKYHSFLYMSLCYGKVLANNTSRLKTYKSFYYQNSLFNDYHFDGLLTRFV